MLFQLAVRLIVLCGLRLAQQKLPCSARMVGLVWYLMAVLDSELSLVALLVLTVFMAVLVGHTIQHYLQQIWSIRINSLWMIWLIKSHLAQMERTYCIFCQYQAQWIQIHSVIWQWMIKVGVDIEIAMFGMIIMIQMGHKNRLMNVG